MGSFKLRRAAVAIAAAAAIISTSNADGADFVTVFQYELTLGDGEPVRTFYFAYQPDGANQAAAFEVDGKPSSVRIPVHSSDPGMRTTFSTLATSMRAAPEGQTTVGDVVAGVAVVTLYLGLPLYAAAKELEKAYEPDLSHIEFPEIDPGLLPPAPASPNAAHERR